MIKSAGQAVLVTSSTRRGLKHRYMAATGDDAQGKTIFNRYRAEAFKSGQNVTDALKGTLWLIPYAQNTDQVDQLRDMTKRLSMLSPDGKSMSDASSALVAAMNGDNGELANSFNIPAEALAEQVCNKPSIHPIWMDLYKSLMSFCKNKAIPNRLLTPC